LAVESDSAGMATYERKKAARRRLCGVVRKPSALAEAIT